MKIDAKPIAANPEEVKAIQAKRVVAKAVAKLAQRKAATFKKSVAETDANEVKLVETKPDAKGRPPGPNRIVPKPVEVPPEEARSGRAKPAEDVKGNLSKAKHSGKKSITCLLCTALHSVQGEAGDGKDGVHKNADTRPVKLKP